MITFALHSFDYTVRNQPKKKKVSMEYKKILTMENLNSRVIAVEYAVRGPIVIRATEIEDEIKSVENIFVDESMTQQFLISFWGCVFRANITIHLIVLFEQILVIVMLVEIKYQ